MPKYISLLRGVNVAGKNKIKMLELRELYESLGFTDVVSYIQSGNVIFSSPNDNKISLSESITSKVAAIFGIKVAVLIKTKKELQRIITNNPFVTNADQDISKLHVTLLFKKATDKAIHKLHTVPLKNDQFQALADAICLYCPNGYGRTKLTNTYLERVLDVPATTRNFKTIRTLHELCG